MQCSENVAEIAQALAQAQIELANPEKEALGRIIEPNGRDMSFRYASLASGTRDRAQDPRRPQDRDDSDDRGRPRPWPSEPDHKTDARLRAVVVIGMAGVPLADTAAPRRMGAALTYARRYALFAMVGIAGEDDLDAPEFQGSPAEPLPSLGLPVHQAASRRARPARVR